MKIALIQPPLWHRETPPLAIASLSSFLRQLGHVVSVFDINCDLYHAVDAEDKKYWSNECSDMWRHDDSVKSFCAKYSPVIDDFVSRIMETNPGMVGFSVHFSSIVMTLTLARLIKKRDHNVTILAGGPECGISRGMTLVSDDSIDGIVVGEGESALAELAANNGKMAQGSSVKGVVFKHNGMPIYGGERDAEVPINTLPFPDFSALPTGRYEYYGWLPFSFSRGCINNCVFCNIHMLFDRFRNFSAQKVFDTIVYQTQHVEGFHGIMFCDSITNGDMQQLSLFCNMLIDAKQNRPELRHLVWQAMHFAIRSELTAAMVEKLSRSGCQSLGFGMESGSDDVLRSMRKMHDVRTAAKVLKLVHEAGIKTTAGFIVGFPTETDEDFNATLEFVKENGRYIDSISVSEMCFSVDKGTAVYDDPGAFAVLPAPHPIYWETVNGNNFPLRMERLKQFKKLVWDMKGKVACYGGDNLYNRHLFEYYNYIGDHQRAEQYRQQSQPEGKSAE